MAWIEDLSDALPAPRDDEPVDLRRDILDELSDHLECAFRREQLTGGLAAAEARVIDRFGSPAAVARQLWRDALWEKIMSQRLMLGLCAAMMLVCCAALGLTASWLNRQESLFQAWQGANDARLKEQSELFTKMLTSSEERSNELAAQIKESQERAAKSQFSEWSPVEVVFRRGSETGPPVEGVKVTVSRSPAYNRTSSSQPVIEENIPNMSKTANAEGRARFERVKFGEYSVTCAIPALQYICNSSVTALPGEQVTKTIVVPAEVPQPRPARIVVAWPDQIRSLEPVLYCGSGGLLVGDYEQLHSLWTASPPLLPGQDGRHGRPPAIGSDGTVRLGGIESQNVPDAWLRTRFRSSPGLIRLLTQLPTALVRPLSDEQFDTIQWPGEGFRFHAATVVFPEDWRRLVEAPDRKIIAVRKFEVR